MSLLVYSFGHLLIYLYVLSAFCKIVTGLGIRVKLSVKINVCMFVCINFLQFLMNLEHWSQRNTW